MDIDDTVIAIMWMAAGHDRFLGRKLAPNYIYIEKY